MNLSEIVRANGEYSDAIGRNVRRALRDSRYRRELEGQWAEFSSTVTEHELPSGFVVPKIALPHIDHAAQIARYSGEWGLPGQFPYGISIYPIESVIEDGRTGYEEPTRIFAGLGSPEMTNRRFLYIQSGQESPRLSTAFDTNTLLGRDAVGEYFGDLGDGGVSVCTFDDVLRLYEGFLEPGLEKKVSISMTINGPSVWMTAARLRAAKERGQDIAKVRGTSQTDPAKEDDAQNELVFPLRDSIKIAMDMFEWCVKNAPYYYPINVSGYHIEQKGATPIEMATFTFANSLIYIEEGLQRGMSINEVAKRLPFFFTSGLDVEYTGLLSAVRRIWAVTMRDCYNATDPKAMQLKAHVQTSGRSLFEREIPNNITRTSIELFYALMNYPQSLHSNSYDEPITTPTEGAVRIASDAQSILLREAGGFKDVMGYFSDSSGRREVYNRNIRDILVYLDRIAEYGGVLEAKADGFFRSQIDESNRRLDAQIRDGTRAVVGVNLYQSGREERAYVPRIEIPDDVKRQRIEDVGRFKARRDSGQVARALAELKEVAGRGGNVFDVTYKHVHLITLGEWTRALQEVYGIYRRSV